MKSAVGFENWILHNRRKSVQLKILFFFSFSLRLWQACTDCWKTYSDRSETRYLTFASLKCWRLRFIYLFFFCVEYSVTMILPELTTAQKKVHVQGFLFLWLSWVENRNTDTTTKALSSERLLPRYACIPLSVDLFANWIVRLNS